MHAHEALIHEFYKAFERKDYDFMAGCYHSQAVFMDPVFGILEGERIGLMWRMLCHQAQHLQVSVSDIVADEHQGRAVWTASYDFGQPARPVTNRIHASFEFTEGQIMQHEDRFSFWRWSRMALGPLGLLLGWHSRVRQQVSRQALKNLEKFNNTINE